MAELFYFGGTPDSYVRDDDTLTLLGGAKITPLYLGTDTPIPLDQLRDGNGDTLDPSLGIIAAGDGAWSFNTVDQPGIDMLAVSADGLTTVRYRNLCSPTANVQVVQALGQATALVTAAQDAAASAAAARSAAQAAQAAAEAAAGTPSGGSFDVSGNYSTSGNWAFSGKVTVAKPTSGNEAARLADVTGAGTVDAGGDTVMRRDDKGKTKVANPSANDDVVNLGTAKALGSADAVEGIARRKTSGALAVAPPDDDEDAVPRGWARTHLLGLPAVDATGGSAVPAGLDPGTVVLRQETPDPAPAWAVSSETSSGVVPLAWTPPADAVPGQLVIVAAVMAGTGTWTAPTGATVLYASQQGASTTVMVLAVPLTEAMLGKAQQVTAASIPTGARAKLLALGYDGVTATGATTPALTVQATATATPSIPGTAAAGAGVLLGLIVGRLTAVVADGAHWTWPSGWVEQYDDAVATTSAVSTVSVAVATKVTDAAASAAAAAPTSDLGATQYIGVQVFLPAVEGAPSGGTTGGSATAGAGTTEWLRTYGRDPLGMLTGAIDVNSLGCPISGAVVWPFGAGTGTFEGVPSNVDPRTLDGWTLTFVPAAGGTTKTITQPTMTRDSVTGSVTLRPALTVS